MEKRDLLSVTIDSLVVPSAGDEGQTMALSAAASSDQPGATLTYQWNFGDNTSQSGTGLTGVTHAYAAPATPGSPYTVTLTVSDGTSQATATTPITITDVAPTVNAGPSQTLAAGSAAAFSGSATDPGGPADITSIQWDFNYNGTTFNADPSANGNLSPSHTYTTPGTYVVALQATDHGGNVSQDLTTVVVKPADALIVHAGADQTVTAGSPVTFAGNYSDPGGTVSSSGIAWDTNYNGSTFNPVLTGSLTPSTTFSTPGSYEVALRITDSTGASDLSVLNLTVNPPSHVGPTANAGSNQVLNDGGTASFNGSYTDPDGTVSSSGIAWDFNYDGSVFNPMTTGTLTPTYQYTAPGSYVAALRITDSNGLTSLSTLTVTVNDPAPTVNAGSNQTVNAGDLVNFSGTASDPAGSLDPLSYAWDFNYNGSTLNPGAASTLTPQHVFTTPGTYTVALQASDAYGVSTLSTLTVTVNSSNGLIVNAGPDQALAEGDTASFAGAYSDGSGTVNTSTAQWDFNYNGTFVADPSANGTLTPTHTFSTPGVYEVALQLTDSNTVTRTGVLYVSVASVDPSVDAGADQTVNEGSTVAFSGTATDPGGTGDALSYAWDFNYDGNTFVAAPNSNTLTPTYVYTTPGVYEAALQVTSASGAVSLATTEVTVNDVVPTATVTNSGPANVGSPVTFTVSNLVDHTPGDTPTFLVDWTGSGTFEPLTSDELTTNPDGSISFSHTYDTPSGTGGYNAVVEIEDGYGGVTNYTTNVVINDALPSVIFGPNGISGSGSYAIDPTVPLQFQFNGPQLTGPQTTYTYYVSLDGGAYTSSSSATYLLPSNISYGQHTLTGYVKDNYGGTSQVSTFTAYVQAPQVTFDNNGSGAVQLNWQGGSTQLSANQSYVISGPATGLTVTLLTSNAVYNLGINVGIDSISAAAGVTNVTLTVSTNGVSGAMLVGDGHIGSISLPSGSTLQQLTARGDLTSISGPSSNGTMTGVTIGSLSFQNLDGSITGVDSIQTLSASGWLGTSASQQVLVAAGIGSLSAYGVGATVIADARQDAGDAVMQVGVGAGGVPGLIDGGNVGNVQIAGNVNIFEAQTQEGNFDPPTVGVDVIGTTKDNPNLEYNSLTALVFTGAATVNSIKAGIGIGAIYAGKGLTVTQKIAALSIGTLYVNGDLFVSPATKNTGVIAVGAMGSTNVTGTMDLNGGRLSAVLGTGSITVGRSLTARVISLFGNTGAISVAQNSESTGWFVGSVLAPKGNTGSIYVNGDFEVGAAPLDHYLVQAKGKLGPITSTGDIGAKQQNPTGDAYRIEGGSIDAIDAQGRKVVNRVGGNIFLVSIRALNGDIKAIDAAATLNASVEAIGGDIRHVGAGTIMGNIRAKVSSTGVGGSIWYVSAATNFALTPQKKPYSIVADDLIGEVKVFGSAGDLIKVLIQAQGGGTFDETTGKDSLGKLVVDVGKATFQGTIIFKAPPKGSAVPVWNFVNGTNLLQLTDSAHANTLWTVKGPAGNASLVYALFDWNPDDVRSGYIPQVGYQGKRTEFSAGGWSIDGPAK